MGCALTTYIVVGGTAALVSIILTVWIGSMVVTAAHSWGDTPRNDEDPR